MIDSLKYLRSPALKCKDIGIRKSEFVTKTQFLSKKFRFLIFCFLPCTAECFPPRHVFHPGSLIYSLQTFFPSYLRGDHKKE